MVFKLAGIKYDPENIQRLVAALASKTFQELITSWTTKLALIGSILSTPAASNGQASTVKQV